MKLKFKYLLNPIYIIIIQYIIIGAIYINLDLNDPYIVEYLICPFAIYLGFIMAMKSLKFKHTTKTKELNYSKILAYSNNYAVKVFLFVISLILLASDISLFARVGFSFANIDSSTIWDIQTNANIIEKIGNYIIVLSPVINSVLYFCSDKAYYKIILIAYNVLTVAYSFIAGKRILIVLALFPIIVAKYYDKKINSRLINRMILIILSVFIIFTLNQKIKTQDSEFTNNVQTMSNYFTKSIENGLRIINWRYDSINPYYWTVYRNLLAMPKHEWFGIDENKLDNIPIHSREEDFMYVYNMGLGSTYNTFSIFGYSYLDFGFKGILVIALNFIVIQLMYYWFINKGGIYIYIYPVFYICLSDQIISNGIYSTRILYIFVGLGLILGLNLFGKLNVIRRKIKNEGTYKESFN